MLSFRFTPVYSLWDEVERALDACYDRRGAIDIILFGEKQFQIRQRFLAPQNDGISLFFWGGEGGDINAFATTNPFGGHFFLKLAWGGIWGSLNFVVFHLGHGSVRSSC